MTRSPAAGSRRRAFTLIELLVVLVIIGIIISLILVAANNARQASDIAATQALITKLDTALTDRIKMLSTQKVNPTFDHYAMARIYGSSATVEGFQRAQVIANYDYMKAEVPDVFIMRPDKVTTGTPAAGVYLVNFAAEAYTSVGGTSGTSADYALPLGSGFGNGQVTGMYGASFTAAGGIYKQLGYSVKGYDGIDNNGDGFIDDYLEGLSGLPAGGQAQINANVKAHTHNTARAEMLYALMVEGQGPFGSILSRDDFTDREIADTDGDGLMEFVDAWGKPLQFYRWPILYKCDQIKGMPDMPTIQTQLAMPSVTEPGPYMSVFEAREQSPLDPNQQLVAPSWWGSPPTTGGGNNNGPSNSSSSGAVSGGAMLFMKYFHTLVEPLAETSGATPNATFFWDRSSSSSSLIYPRRAFYFRPLILSGGPDGIPGTAQLNFNYLGLDSRGQFPLAKLRAGKMYDTIRDTTGTAVPATDPLATIPYVSSNIDAFVTLVIRIENQAAKIDPTRTGTFYAPTFPSSIDPYRNDTSTFLEEASGDDVANLSQASSTASQ